MAELFQVLMGNIPALLSILLGIVLIVVEMCIPGFGVPGILGLILVSVGIGVGAATALQALMLVGIVLGVLIIALPFCLRSIAKGRLSKSKMVLDTVSVDREQTDRVLSQLVGREGTTLTALRPAGVGLFDQGRMDVVSEGDFISEGAAVRIERVDGNRIVVVAVKSE